MEKCSHYANAATIHLHHFTQDGADKWQEWERYKEQNRLASKHYGIAKAMITKELKKGRN